MTEKSWTKIYLKTGKVPLGGLYDSYIFELSFT